MKFYGISFLSRESKVVMEKAKEKGKLEPGITMLFPQILLALGCILLGIFPYLAYLFFGRAFKIGTIGITSLLPKMSMNLKGLYSGLVLGNSTALFRPLVLVGIFSLLFVLAFIISRLGSSPYKKGESWLCGYGTEADIYRYRAHDLYAELKTYFRWVGAKPKSKPKKE